MGKFYNFLMMHFSSLMRERNLSLYNCVVFSGLILQLRYLGFFFHWSVSKSSGMLEVFSVHLIT